ncbi:hypothetical protein GCM10009678_55720 [Actinomadura kijaniata]
MPLGVEGIGKAHNSLLAVYYPESLIHLLYREVQVSEVNFSFWCGSHPEEEIADWVTFNDAIEKALNVFLAPAEAALEVGHSNFSGPRQFHKLVDLEC